MKLRLPRGIRDIDPETYEKFNVIYNAFLDTCKLYNYKVMEPATIELFETLALKSGPDIEKEIYAFKDKAGRLLGLRFDLTVGLTRYVVSNPQLRKPVKLAAYSVQWRYDEPQYGRYRSFYAWDIEIYGGVEEFSMIDILLFCDTLFTNVGLKKYEFLISDRRLIEGLIRTEAPKSDVISVMRVIDKFGKIKENELISQMEKYGVSAENGKDILTFIYKGDRNINKIIELAKYSGPLLLIYDCAKDIGLPVKLDLKVVRGLDYYDGVVFEVYDKIAKDIGAICGGGTYTQLTRVFGSDLVACGCAGGIERLILSLEKEGVKMKSKEYTKVYIVITGEDLFLYGIKIADMLRRQGISTDINLTKRSLKSQFEYAVKEKYDYVIIVGEKEVKKNIYSIKDMKREEQYTFDNINSLISCIIKQSN